MILRTYGCENCGHTMTVELRADQWNADPPECPACAGETYQEFSPPAIGGSAHGRASALAETIAAEDYQVADMPTSQSRGRVRYKDQGPEAIPASSWAQAGSQLQQAVALGRETRLRYGNGLDVLKSALDSGAQPDLIAESKRRSIRVY
jgi:NAD-dependent SIR2 family protein deacetylase